MDKGVKKLYKSFLQKIADKYALRQFEKKKQDERDQINKIIASKAVRIIIVCNGDTIYDSDNEKEYEKIPQDVKEAICLDLLKTISKVKKLSNTQKRQKRTLVLDAKSSLDSLFPSEEYANLCCAY